MTLDWVHSPGCCVWRMLPLETHTTLCSVYFCGSGLIKLLLDVHTVCGLWGEGTLEAVKELHETKKRVLVSSSSSFDFWHKWSEFLSLRKLFFRYSVCVPLTVFNNSTIFCISLNSILYLDKFNTGNIIRLIIALSCQFTCDDNKSPNI